MWDRGPASRLVPAPLHNRRLAGSPTTALPPRVARHRPPLWRMVYSISLVLDFHAIQCSVGTGGFLFLNRCCSKSLLSGWARGHRGSTDASILAGSPPAGSHASPASPTCPAGPLLGSAGLRGRFQAPTEGHTHKKRFHPYFLTYEHTLHVLSEPCSFPGKVTQL